MTVRRTFSLASGKEISDLVEIPEGQEPEEYAEEIRQELSNAKGFIRFGATIVHPGAVAGVEID